MKIFRTTSELLKWRKEGVSGLLGFVPTMGALHEGHASLLRRARKESDVVVLSILVNPTQFGDVSDLENYPQTLEKDLKVAEKECVDAVFVPTPEDLYGGTPAAESVDWGAITSDFEAAFRPGHFDGVVAVVDKLFTVTTPDKAFFGEKDLQQVAVIRKLASLYHKNVTIVSCDLIRDTDGLALSSRNIRLSDEGRKTALELSKSLKCVLTSSNKEDQIQIEASRLNSTEGVDLGYIAGVNEFTYSKNDAPETWTHVIITAEVEGVRLIDNIRL